MTAVAAHYRWWTTNNTFTPHTPAWANYVIRTELNKEMSRYKLGDYIYLIYKQKVTILRLDLATTFTPVSLGLDERALRAEARRSREGSRTEHQASERMRRSHQEVIRHIERRDRDYQFLRGRINDRCDGTSTDCDR